MSTVFRLESAQAQLRPPRVPSRSEGGSNAPSPQVSNRVRVVVRVRPPIAEDIHANNEFRCAVRTPNQQSLVLSKPPFDDREFAFDHVLPQDSEQDEMYAVVAQPIVSDVLQGYNGTVLAYGQTGSGKTYTVFGPGGAWMDGAAGMGVSGVENCSGVIPRAIEQLFGHFRSVADTVEFRVTASVMQIYMENIMDLLDMEKRNLPIREDPKLGIFVDGLTQVMVESPEEVYELINVASTNRATADTNMNKLSSRSHVIMQFTVEQRTMDGETGAYGAAADSQKNTSPSKRKVKRGTLSLVDLAGSERVSKSGSEGQRLEEAKRINKSLSALGNCVAALTDPNASHVPFRDSKLTRLLTDSLGGNSKTCLCATIGPAIYNYDESYSTLLFATRAMNVRNHAIINEVVDFKVLSGNLQKQIRVMEHEKEELFQRNFELEQELASLRNEIREMKTSTPRPAMYAPAPQSPMAIPGFGLPTMASATPRDSGGYGGGSVQSAARSMGGGSVQAMHATGGGSGAESAGAGGEWERRERELVTKFTTIIQRLQTEVARQQDELMDVKNHMMSMGSNPNAYGDFILDQIADGVLKIPALRERIAQKLAGTAGDKENSSALRPSAAEYNTANVGAHGQMRPPSAGGLQKPLSTQSYPPQKAFDTMSQSSHQSQSHQQSPASSYGHQQSHPQQYGHPMMQSSAQTAPVQNWSNSRSGSFSSTPMSGGQRPQTPTMPAGTVMPSSAYRPQSASSARY